METRSHCCHGAPGQGDGDTPFPRPGRRLLLVAGLFLGIFWLSWLLPVPALFESLARYTATIWWAVLLGLLLGGVIDYFVPRSVVVRLLGRSGPGTLLNAAFAGVLMSACSHGILAIAIQLYKKGASIPAVVTFLLATPWANLPMTLLLFGFFGWHAVLIVAGAITVALLTGLVYLGLERRGLLESTPERFGDESTDWSAFHNFSALSALRGIAAGAVSLANIVLWWILIGVLAAAAIAAFVPPQWFMNYLGPDLPGMLVTLVFATVLEVCSEGTSPLAFEIYAQTGTLGNPFVFLLAGVATDYTEIGLLWSNIGRRTALLLPLVTVPQILLIAWWLNRLGGI